MFMVHFSWKLHCGALVDVASQQYTSCFSTHFGCKVMTACLRCNSTWSGTEAYHLVCRGGATAAAAAAADSAAHTAESELLGSNLPVELDEFGRNINIEKKRELANRAQLRQRLLQHLQGLLKRMVDDGTVPPFDASLLQVSQSGFSTSGGASGGW